MATSVHTLKADVILDTDGLRRGADLSRSELGKLRSTFRRLQTSEEKQAKQLEVLEKAYRDGVITARQYEVAQQRLAAQMTRTTRTAGQQQKAVGQQRGAFEGIAQAIPGGGALGRFTGVGKATAGVSAATAAVAANLKVVESLTRLTVRQSEFNTALADSADKIGATVGGLRGIQAAAELTGVDARTTAMGLQRMTRRISEASQGTGEAQKALRELGLDAKDLASLRPEDQFLEIAEAMKEINNTGDQLRLSFRLFDSEGAALVNTLRTSQEELERQRDRFGDLFDDELVTNSRRLQEELAEFKLVAESAAVSISDQLMPAVSGFVQLAGEAVGGRESSVEGQAVQDSLIRTIGNFISPGAGTLLGPSGVPSSGTVLSPALRPDQQAGFVDRERQERVARRNFAAVQDRIGEQSTQSVNQLGSLVSNTLQNASNAMQSAMSDVQGQLTGVLMGEVERRKEHLQQLTETRQAEIDAQKRFNSQLEDNLLAPALTQQDAARLEAESIARERFGGQAFDTNRAEKELEETQKKLTQEIKNLIEAIRNPTRLNSGEEVGILDSLTDLIS